VLTPEQAQQAQRYIVRHVMAAKFAESVRDRLQAAASNLGLSAEQLNYIEETHATFEPKYRALAEQRRELMRAEMKAIGEILTPEQREQVRDICEDRVVVSRAKADRDESRTVAHLKETVHERLDAAADKLNLSEEQRKQIKEKCASFLGTYTSQRSQREALRREELAGVASILTAEQREKVRDFVADHVDSQ